MRYEGCLLTESESQTLIDDVDRWCRRTGTNYNKLVVAAGVAVSIRSMVRVKGKRVTFKVSDRLRNAMAQYRFGIPRGEHKARVASIRLRPSNHPTIAEIHARRVNRDPCPMCNVRADIGCRHSQRF